MAPPMMMMSSSLFPIRSAPVVNVVTTTIVEGVSAACEEMANTFALQGTATWTVTAKTAGSVVSNAVEDADDAEMNFRLQFQRVDKPFCSLN